MLFGLHFNDILFGDVLVMYIWVVDSYFDDIWAIFRLCFVGILRIFGGYILVARIFYY